MKRARSAVVMGLAALLAGVGGAVSAQTSPAVDATMQANRASAAAQQQIDQLDDQTRALLERYRAALWQTQQLSVYAQQVGPLLAGQEADRAALQQQLGQFNASSKDLTPLLLRMIDSLDKFVGLDLPFLQQERRDRVAALKRLMGDAGTPQAEKYRRVLEAYRIEADYGASLGAERMQLPAEAGGKVVEVLHLGRVALYSLSLDGAEAAVWDAQAKQWRGLQGRYRGAVREGLKIAHESVAPEVLELPVPAASGSPVSLAPNPLRLALNRMGGALLEALVPSAQAAGIDDLLKQIRDSAQQNARIDQERIQKFIRNKGEQQAQLAEAEGQLKSAQAKADATRGRYEANQKAIADLKNQLQAQAGDLGQAYAAVREAATQFRNNVNESYLSAQFPERLKLLETLADPNTLPSPKQLEDFWFTLQQEMTENGKVARFDAEVIDAEGKPGRASVVRVGPFIAFSGGKYLVTQPGGRLQVAERQTFDTGMARSFESTGGNAWAPVPIDPTHGTLLRLAAQRPTLFERIQQGQLVGYVIIVVGLIGAALALFQLVYLYLVGGKVNKQLQNLAMPTADNPLGRVLSCLKDDTAVHDPEVLETRISEAVLRETPKIERFQPFLRMVVAAGPLLGLLGTVTGMIITFQVITEIGAGDPKVMAGGISQAMISTVLGLIIAIPILFINSVLAARSRILVQILDEQSAGMLAARLEQQHGR